MRNSNLLVFMLKNSLAENKVTEKEVEAKNVIDKNRMFKYSKFATVPIEIRK